MRLVVNSIFFIQYVFIDRILSNLSKGMNRMYPAILILVILHWLTSTFSAVLGESLSENECHMLLFDNNQTNKYLFSTRHFGYITYPSALVSLCFFLSANKYIWSSGFIIDILPWSNYYVFNFSKVYGHLVCAQPPLALASPLAKINLPDAVSVVSSAHVLADKYSKVLGKSFT